MSASAASVDVLGRSTKKTCPCGALIGRTTESCPECGHRFIGRDRLARISREARRVALQVAGSVVAAVPAAPKGPEFDAIATPDGGLRLWRPSGEWLLNRRELDIVRMELALS